MAKTKGSKGDLESARYCPLQGLSEESPPVLCFQAECEWWHKAMRQCIVQSIWGALNGIYTRARVKQE